MPEFNVFTATRAELQARIVWAKKYPCLKCGEKVCPL